MADKSFTLLQIRLGDGDVQIGPKSLGAGSTADAADGTHEAESTAGSDAATRSCPCPMCSDGCDCPACKLGKAALVLGLLAALAVAAWKLLGGGEFEDLEEIEDEVEELVD
ncbi:hypothetical protein [Haloparvum sedimenti]|uniref:hypothetical protein n=1 Tax=Haloparvum sedimenti TaxID=1678448 RepID=UPI00071E7B77|nr:hypothetical protein [Haloparvum sedimenti]